MSIVIIGLFFIFLGFALAAIIVCCFFWYICCNAMINAWTAYRRREGRSLVPSARPPSSRAPSGRAHDHALRDIFPLRNPAGSFSHGSSTSRSPQPTPPPDYNTIEFYPQENDSLPTYEEALASEK